MEHPITPPPQLVQQWWTEADNQLAPYYDYIATQAARWGADAELEACCHLLREARLSVAQELRATRRPKPPSLAEQGQRILVENGRTFGGRVEFDLEDVVTLRAALKRLQELENNG